MSQLPKGWCEVKLGELIELKYGKALPAKIRDGEGYPVYGSNGVVGLHSEALVEGGGIIVGRKGSFGEVHLCEKDFSPIDTTYFVDEFPCGSTKYWYYQLKKLPLTKLNRSTAIPGLNRDDAYAQEVLLPPDAEQTRIVEKLDEVLAQVDTIKARLDSIPAIIKRFRQSVLTAAVSGKLTEEWRGNKDKNWLENTKIDSICESSFYGPRFSKDDYTDDGVPTIRTTDMTDSGGIQITHDTPRINVPDDKLEQFKVNQGDLLVTRSGSVGVMAIFNGDYLAIPSAYLIRFRFKASVMVEYIYAYLTSPLGQQLLGLNATTTTQANINAKSIRNIELDLPPLKEQKEIVRLVDQYFAFADTIEAQVKKAQKRVDNLTQSILAKAFRGELVPQDPSDEPADKLLERIAQARIEAEALAKAAKKIEADKKRAAKKASA